jgi:hypothetical protein
MPQASIKAALATVDGLRLTDEYAVQGRELPAAYLRFEGTEKDRHAFQWTVVVATGAGEEGDQWVGVEELANDVYAAIERTADVLPGVITAITLKSGQLTQFGGGGPLRGFELLCTDT